MNSQNNHSQGHSSNSNVITSYSLNDSSSKDAIKNTANNQAKTSLTIAKFGGTSVADFDAMQRCAKLINARKDVRLVVLSASAGVTNLLVELANGLEPQSRQLNLDKISTIQNNIISHLVEKTDVSIRVSELLSRIAELADLAYKSENADEQLMIADELVAHGELLSTTLFVEVMLQEGGQAVWFDVRNVLKTDSRFGRALPNIELIQKQTTSSLSDLVATNVVITQGFIGSDSQNRTTTLGRGGSDYSAALIAEGLNAKQVDIWTDVPGIYTTDPRIAPLAKPIPNITFEEAAEMATFGAKILHPATLLPAVRSNIPVFIGSSKAPDAGGTYVTQTAENPPLFRAVTLRRQQTLLTLHSLQMLHARGFLAEIFAILAKHQISVDLITTSEISVALTLDTTGSNTTGGSLITQALLDELSLLCRVEVEENLTLVAVIGNNLNQATGLGNTIFSVLQPFNIRLICYGASSHNLCLLVNGNDGDDVVRVLHKELFEA